MSTVGHIQVFTRVAELASFTQAADALNLPKGSVSMAVQQLEAKLGVRLLHRTTRKVQLTQDGQAFYERSKDVLADMDELQTMFQQTDAQSLKGRVRIDMSTGLARTAVVPRLPELLASQPLLEIEISSTDRKVDLVREGFDCVIRVGSVAEPGLIARPLGQMRMVNCVSPSYIKRHGCPQSLADLSQHQLVHWVGTLGGKSVGFEYAPVDAPSARSVDINIEMTGALTVNNAVAYVEACVAGVGLIQVPAVGVSDLIAQGKLVVVLGDDVPSAMPVTMLYASRRNLSKRVRVVMDWLAEVVHAHLAADAAVAVQK